MLAFGILINIAVILYFKYANFILTNIGTITHQDFVLKNIVLPLGISFFTFQQISYLTDSYHGNTKQYSWLEYTVFVCFFPQLVAGPIVLHNEIIPQLRDQTKQVPDYKNIAKGIMILNLGLLKKVVIADTFNQPVAWGFNNYLNASSGELLIVMLAYTFQIYFDFSGYSDMAVGAAKILNIDIPVNFNSPYKACSIKEFWKKWHISLTVFLTKYVYIPLGGHNGTLQTCMNIMAVFLLSGIWHGANWTFILWGCLHGMLRIIDLILDKRNLKIHTVFRWLGTFLAVNVLWLLFRAQSVSQWIYIVKRICCLNMSVCREFMDLFKNSEIREIFSLIRFSFIYDNLSGFAMFFILIFSLVLCLCCENNYNRDYKINLKRG